MSITVDIHPNLRHLTEDKGVVEVQGKTVGECIRDLIRQYPALERWIFDEKGELLNYIDVYVNMGSSFPLELKKPVQDGDEISIILMIAGG